jgi:hypothetical protein
MGRKRQSVVTVVWLDAHPGNNTDSGSWGDWSAKKDHRGRKILSVGIVLKDTKAGITLAQSKDRHARKYDHTLFIPAGCIVEVTDVTP